MNIANQGLGRALFAATLCAAMIVLVPIDLARAQELPWTTPWGMSDLQQRVTVQATPSHVQVVPGGRFHVALRVNLADGWNLYSYDPGDDVIPAGVKVSSDVFAPQEPLWPEHREYAVDVGSSRIVNYVYSNSATIFVPFDVPADADEGTYSISIALTGQVCGDDQCLTLGNEVNAAMSLTVGAQELANPDWTDDKSLADALDKAMLVEGSIQFDDAPAVLYGLGLALLAGLMLNIMPCVLPVVPMRILSLTELGGQSRRRFVTIGLAFAGGMMLFFAALAVANIVIRVTLGRGLSWGEHYQLPAVRIALALVVGALAANLFGLYTVTVPRWLSFSGGKSDPSSRGKHITAGGWGFMMALLATPCSFVFLTGTMTWAQLQPVWLGTTAILMLGVGMSAPHAMLCAFPGLLKCLPRPGRWMELMRQTMGFMLLLLAVYLIHTLHGGSSYPFWVAGYAVVLCMCLWMWGSWTRYDAPLKRRLMVKGVSAVLAVGAGAFMLTPPKPLAVDFQPFSEAALSSAQADDKPVIVKFTASWCVSCHVIDYKVYDRPELADALAKRGVVALKADVTDEGSPASEFLKSRFNMPVPLTAIYLRDEDPVLLPGDFSIDELLELIGPIDGN